MGRLDRFLTRLLGRQPPPPRCALENFASRFGYHTEAEGRATVDKFIAEGIPLDAIIFGLYRFGKDVKGTLGKLQFARDAFPTSTEMIADFDKLGVKTILVTEPFVLTTSNRWQDPGGATASISVVPGHIPVFVRAGAFIPMIEVIQTTKNYSTRKFDLHYYHDNSVVAGSGKLYDDDGMTPYAFEKGGFEILRFTSAFKGHVLSISLNSERGKNHTPEERIVALAIHNIA